MQKQVPKSAEDKKWATDLIDHMAKMSPTSMKVTLRQLREGRKLNTLHECLEMEYR
jgi:3-hydroxyisobutyryl-CoA hydrolase